MRDARLIVLLAAALSFGCSYNQIAAVDADGQQTVYTNSYDVGVWNKDRTVGIQLAIDSEKKEVPGLYELSRYLGALGPDDGISRGVVTLYPMNFRATPVELKILEVGYLTGSVPLDEPLVQVVPVKRWTRVPVGELPISTYATSLDVRLRLAIDGIEEELLVSVPRLTARDLQEKYGGDNRPYPWMSLM